MFIKNSEKIMVIIFKDDLSLLASTTMMNYLCKYIDMRNGGSVTGTSIGYWIHKINVEVAVVKHGFVNRFELVGNSYIICMSIDYK